MKKELEYRHYAFAVERNTETRDIFGADGKIYGHAIVFNAGSQDLGGFIEYVDKEALNGTLSDGHNIYALWSHDQRQAPLGSTKSATLTLTVDATGLAFTLEPDRLTVAQLAAIRDGDMRMSFGFYAKVQEWADLDQPVVTRILKQIDLSEISFVIDPAYPDTTAAVRSMTEARDEKTPSVNILAEAATTESISINTFDITAEADALTLDIIESLIHSRL